MLKKSHISVFKMADEGGNYREEWKKARLGRITSSRISTICAPEGIGKTGKSYLLDRLGEEMTGESADPELNTDAVRWGLLHEREAINKFGLIKGLKFVVIQQFISAPGSRFGSTPDALIIVRESIDKTEYETETLECKCPPTYKAFIPLSLAETPQDIKKLLRNIIFKCSTKCSNAMHKRDT